MRVYSMGLRVRVLKAAEGGVSTAELTVRFGSLSADMYDEWTSVRVRDAVIRELACVTDAVRVYRATRAALTRMRD